MAEIEHFVDPEGGKKHPRFASVRDVMLTLFPGERQMAGTGTIQMTVGEAVDKVGLRLRSVRLPLGAN